MSHQEIESWARLLRVDISPFEVDVLRRLDREYRSWLQEKNAPPKQSIGDALRDIAEANAAKKASKQSQKPAPKAKK